VSKAYKAAASNPNLVGNVARLAAGAYVYTKGVAKKGLQYGGQYAAKAAQHINTVTQSAQKAVKPVVEKVANNAAVKATTKAASKGVSNMAKYAATSAGKMSNIASIAGLVGNITGDYLASEGIIKQGGVAHKSIGALSTAAEWGGTAAMVGSIGGPIVAGILGGIGAIAGGLYGWFSREEEEEPPPPPPQLDFVKKESSREILDNFMASRVKAIPEDGSSYAHNGADRANNDVHIKSDPHEINVNGTLYLKGQNGETIDLISELRQNPDMMRSLASMISNEMKYMEHQGNFS
jgi:hypothetical protein